MVFDVLWRWVTAIISALGMFTLLLAVAVGLLFLWSWFTSKKFVDTEEKVVGYKPPKKNETAPQSTAETTPAPAPEPAPTPAPIQQNNKAPEIKDDPYAKTREGFRVTI